jgi:hypothetical protein
MSGSDHPPLSPADLAAAEARAAAAEARASAAEALIAQLKLMIEKLRRELYGKRSERKANLIEQLALELEELQASATEDELRAESTTPQQVQGFTRPDAAGSPAMPRSPRRWTTCSSAGRRSPASSTTAGSASRTMPPNERKSWLFCGSDRGVKRHQELTPWRHRELTPESASVRWRAAGGRCLCAHLDKPGAHALSTGWRASGPALSRPERRFSRRR